MLCDKLQSQVDEYKPTLKQVEITLTYVGLTNCNGERTTSKHENYVFCGQSVDCVLTVLPSITVGYVAKRLLVYLRSHYAKLRYLVCIYNNVQKYIRTSQHEAVNRQLPSKIPSIHYT